MKKLTFLSTALIIMFAGIFTACEDASEAEGPTLSFFAGDQQEFITSDVGVAPGAVLQFSWLAVKGDRNLTSMEVTRDGAYLVGYPDEKIPNDNYRDTLMTEAPANTGSYVYAFEVFDRNENSDVKEFTITVSVEAPQDYTVTLGAQSSTTGSSFASADGSVYNLAEASSNSDAVDFIYFYGATNAATLSAPDNLTDLNEVFGTTGNAPDTWSTNNDTRFKTTALSSAEFDAITAAGDLTQYTVSASDLKANQLAVGDVVAFLTADGKSGLVKVTQFTTEDSSGEITIEVKVQP